MSVRIVVTGATGNVGTSVVKALVDDAEVGSVLGIARRVPEWSPSKVEWESADVARSSLVPLLEGADAVIHLAWLIQPSRDQEETRAVNVEGSRRVFKAAAVAKVPRLVYASSVGAYSPGPKHVTVDESHPTGGISSSFYSRHKAEVESVLDEFEADHANVSVARLRPGLIFKGEAASGIRRLFAGPFLPHPAAAPLPDSVRARHRGTALPGCPLRRRRGDVSARGKERSRWCLQRRCRAGTRSSRAGAPARSQARQGPHGAAAGRDRSQLEGPPPAHAPRVLDMALSVPLMDTTRARSRLGWAPSRSSGEALLELIDGMRRGEGFPTPPLEPGGSGPLRLGELATGIGARSFRGARQPARSGSG